MKSENPIELMESLGFTYKPETYPPEQVKFIQKYALLCEKYGMEIESEDSYCGLEVVEYEDE